MPAKKTNGTSFVLILSRYIPDFSSDLKRCTLLSLNMNYAFAHTYAPECMANKLP